MVITVHKKKRKKKEIKLDGEQGMGRKECNNNKNK